VSPTESVNTETVSVPTEPARRNLPLSLLSKFYLQVALVLGMVLAAIFIPYFATPGNIQTVLMQASFAGIIACGMTLLIAGGQFDLSVAGILAVSAIASAAILPHTTVLLAILVALGAGVGLGLVNGLVVTKLRIPAFIATLGTFNVYLAIAFISTNGEVVRIESVNYLTFATAKPAGIPIAFIVFVAVCLIMHFVLRRTYFGRDARGTGSSEPAARVAGLRVDRTKLIAFAITGLLSAVAGIFLSGLLSSANGTMSTGIELNAITIAVVGGTALRGGSGTMLGTFTAAVLVSLVDNALILLQVDSYWQYIVVGAILIIALVAGSMRKGAGEVRGAL
jgi:ribose/xylose/arabinose/galactoside ABC-type transport system permease subunit